MHVTLFPLSPSRLSLTWEFSPDEVNLALDRIEAGMRKELQRLSQRPPEWKRRGRPAPQPQSSAIPAALRSLRPNKIPRPLLWLHLGGEMRRRYIEGMLPQLWRETVEEQAIQLAGQPQFEQVEVNRDKPLVLKAEVDVLPVLNLTPEQYRGLYVEVPAQGELTEAVVDQAMTGLQHDYVIFRALPADASIQMGDWVLMRYADRQQGQEAFTAEQQIGFVLGDGSMRSDFETMLIGGQRGLERTFALASPQGEGEFHVVIDDIKRRELPTLEAIAQEEGLPDTAALRERIATRLAESMSQRHEFNLRMALLSRILHGLPPFPVPQAMVQARFNLVVQEYRMTCLRQGTPMDSSEEQKQRLYAISEQRAREEIVLDEIARKEGFTNLEAEVSLELTRIAERDRQPVDEVRDEFKREGRLALLEKHLLWTKTLRWLVKESRVTEVMEVSL